MDAFRENIRQYRNHFKLGGCKIFLDGSPQGRTAWMRAPYEPQEGQPADYRGYGTMTDEAVRDANRKARESKMQLLAHCNGDGACGPVSGLLGAGSGRRADRTGKACRGPYAGEMTVR